MVFYSQFTAVSIYFRMIHFSKKVFDWQFRLWSLHSCGGQAQPLRLWCWYVLNSHAVFSKSEHFSEKKQLKNHMKCSRLWILYHAPAHIHTTNTHYIWIIDIMQWKTVRSWSVESLHLTAPTRRQRTECFFFFFLSEVTYKAAKSPTGSSSYMTAKTGLEPWGQNRMRGIAKQGYLAGRICCAEKQKWVAKRKLL